MKDLSELSGLIAKVDLQVRAKLDSLGTWAIVGGACRDTLLGVPFKDLDIVVWASMEDFIEVFKDVDSSPYLFSKSDKYADLTCKFSKAVEYQIWVASPSFKVPNQWNFDYTINCFGVYHTSEVFCHPEALAHLERRELHSAGGCLFSLQREAYMINKGFKLCLEES